METINHECYVSLDVAKLLKEAGFDWKCRKCYNKGVLFDMEPDEIRTQIPQHSSYDILAPTLEVAQRWLREVKDIDVYIFPTTNNKRGCVYEWGIKTFGRALLVEGQPYTNQYETYEEAQEAGIKKALEIILEIGE